MKKELTRAEKNLVKMTDISKVYTPETVALLREAGKKNTDALAHAALEAARFEGGMDKRGFADSLRKVAHITASTSVLGKALSVAKKQDATIESVAAAIDEQKEKERVSAMLRRKAEKKPQQAEKKPQQAGAVPGAPADLGLGIEALDDKALEEYAETLKRALSKVQALQKERKTAAEANMTKQAGS